MNEDFLSRVYSNPEEFSLGEHRWVHKPTGIYIWIANGFWFYKFNPGGPSSLRDKWRIGKAFRWWFTNAPLEGVL